jgi:hypothetical protein
MENAVDPLKRADTSDQANELEEQEEPQAYTAELAAGEVDGSQRAANGSLAFRARRSTVQSLSQSIASRLEQETGVDSDDQDNKDDGTESEEELTKQPTLIRRGFKLFWGYFRPYFVIDHLDWGSLKPIIRTLVQFWVAIVLMEITAVNAWLGNAAYLTIIISIVVASGQLPVIMAFVLPLTSLVGVVFAFAVSVVVLAINNRIRGFPSEESVAVELIHAGICQNNAELSHCVSEQIFSGRYLTTKTTVITVIGYMFAQIVLYVFKTLNPLFIPGSIIGNIILMILIFYNNLVPFFKPTLIGVS